MIESSYWALFVAGTPRQLGEGDLYNYFRKFGPVVHFEERRSSDVKSPTFKLVVADQQTYHSILNSTHNLYGRNLFVKPFKTGQGLVRQNLQTNKRRVIAKRVPSWLSEFLFQAWITKMAGPVDKLFAFDPDNSDPRQRLVRSYSILFFTREGASRLAEIGEFAFPMSNSVTEFKKFKVSKQTKIGTTSQIHHFTKEQSSKDGQYSMACSEIKTEQMSTDKKSNNIKENQSWCYHNTKPTSIHYNFLRGSNLYSVKNNGSLLFRIRAPRS